jgi:hypothetical protein
MQHPDWDDQDYAVSHHSGYPRGSQLTGLEVELRVGVLLEFRHDGCFADSLA